MSIFADFTFLLIYLHSAHGLLSLGHLGSTNTPSSSSSWLIQLSRDQLLSITMCWHTKNNQSITTMAHQPLPKKHVRKKLILLASTDRQESRGFGSIVLDRTILSKMVQVSLSYISYEINVGIGIPTTTTTKLQPKRTEQCHQKMVIQSSYPWYLTVGVGCQ